MNKIRAALKSHRRVLMVAPTGYGKSTLIAEMFSSIYKKGKSAWFVIHRVELREQVEAILKRAGIPYGLIIAGTKYDPTQNIQICMAMTLVNRIGIMKKPSICFLDEAHISCSNTYKKILTQLPDTYIIGGSGTPQRTDRKPMKEVYDYMICSEDTRWLIENGYLAKYKLFRPSKINLDDVSIKRGDYDQKELSATLDKSSITGDSLDHYMKLAKGKKFIIFDYSVKSSRETAELFTAAGYPCSHVDAETPKAERKDALDKFRRGELMGLSNYSLFTEGVDIPDIECVILKRPTKSIIIYRQSIGRGLRKTTPDKVLIILDHAGASIEHGLPCDKVEWSLEGKKKKSGENITPTKTCPYCYAVAKAAAKHCEECGGVFLVTQKKMIFVDGSLEEVNIEEARKNRLELFAAAKSLKEHQQVALKMGYKRGYGYYIWQGKQKRGANTGGHSAGVQQGQNPPI